MGLLDTSDTGGGGPDWGVGSTYGQAVTDIVGGKESYVDGYGPGVGNSDGTPGVTGSTTSLLTITGFLLGNTPSSGDILNFDVNDWAIGSLATRGATDFGLAETDGASMVTEGEHNADATVFDVGFAGEWTTTGIGAGTHSGAFAEANVIVDRISPYANAEQLVKGLTTLGVGDITFAGMNLSKGDVVHLLIAYQVAGGAGGVMIDDVTITANADDKPGIANGINTADAALTIKAVDMVLLVGQNAADLGPHNIHFV